MGALQTIPYQTKKLQTEKLWRLNCRLAFWKFGSSFTNAGAAFPPLVWWRRLTWGASLNLRPRRLPATLARSHSAAAAAIWPLSSAFIHHLGPDDPGRRGSRSQERLKAHDRRIRPALFWVTCDYWCAKIELNAAAGDRRRCLLLPSLPQNKVRV